VLARDDTPHSATTTQTDLRDPAVRLGEATARYLDSLHALAETSPDLPSSTGPEQRPTN
jgi:hypothetical protein